MIHKSKDLFNTLLPVGKNGVFILLPLFLVGLIAMIKEKNAGLLILTFSPIIIHLLLSALTFYPLAIRFVLYLCPPIIIATMFGLEFLTGRFFKNIPIKRVQFVILLIPLIFILLLSKKEFPIRINEIKESISYLAKQKKTNEKLFVDFPLASAFKYYQAIHLTAIDSVEFGNSSRKINQELLQGLKKTNDKLWLLAGYPFKNQTSNLLTELETERIPYSLKFLTKGSNVYFIDFSRQTGSQ